MRIEHTPTEVLEEQKSELLYAVDELESHIDQGDPSVSWDEYHEVQAQLTAIDSELFERRDYQYRMKASGW